MSCFGFISRTGRNTCPNARREWFPVTAGTYDSVVVQNPLSKVVFAFYMKCVTEFYALPGNNSSDASVSFGLCRSGLAIMLGSGVPEPRAPRG